MDKEQPSEVAFHEVGHAAVAESLGGLVLKQTVIPEGRALGYVVASFECFQLLEKVVRMVKQLGGIFSEALCSKKIYPGQHHHSPL